MAFNAEKYDTDKFINGSWTDIMGGKFKVARAGNPVYEKALEDSGFRKKEDPEEKARALYKAISVGILKDWAEVVDAQGQNIPFSVDNSVQVLMDNPDLSNKVLAKANDLEIHLREDTATQAKKPKTTSGS